MGNLLTIIMALGLSLAAEAEVVLKCESRTGLGGNCQSKLSIEQSAGGQIHYSMQIRENIHGACKSSFNYENAGGLMQFDLVQLEGENVLIALQPSQNLHFTDRSQNVQVSFRPTHCRDVFIATGAETAFPGSLPESLAAAKAAARELANKRCGFSAKLIGDFSVRRIAYHYEAKALFSCVR